MEALKDFVYRQGAAINVTNGLAAGVETVRNYWDQITAAWKRKYEATRIDIVETVTNVRTSTLHKELKY